MSRVRVAEPIRAVDQLKAGGGKPSPRTDAGSASSTINRTDGAKRTGPSTLLPADNGSRAGGIVDTGYL